MANLSAWISNNINTEGASNLGDEQPLRSELLSIDLLNHYAHELAQNRRVENGRGPNILLPRLTSNEKTLRDYNEQTLEAEKRRRVTPAAEWLLDNFHLIEEQIHTAQRHLPRRFNRELPQLLNGPWKDFPRVYEIAVELVSHTDGRIDASHLTSFVAGYQEVVPLKLGELWAIPIMLRLGLIENLRRVAVLLGGMRKDRDHAEEWADRILEVAETKPSRLIVIVAEMAESHPTLNRAFVTEFVRRMQEKSSPVKLAVSWIEERIAEDGLTVEQMIQAESQHQAATQVSVGNCIGSLRFLDTMDWRKFVEEQSVVEQALRSDPAKIYLTMDFATRDLYRHTVERIARHSKKNELEIADLALDLARQNVTPPGSRKSHVGFFLTGKGVNMLEHAAGMRIPVRSILSRLGRRYPLAFYLGGIAGVALLVTIPFLKWVAKMGISNWAFGLVAILALLCTSQLGVSLVNWFATIFVRPSVLPRLDFSEGIPQEHATLVVVPTMLNNAEGIENLLESLEVRYLANLDPNVYFALLTDFSDAKEEHLAGDEALLQQTCKGIHVIKSKI